MVLTVGVVAAILVLLVTDKAPPDMAFGAGLIVLLFGGVISPQEALSGFSNRGVATVGLLFIVSRAVQNTGVFQVVADRFLGEHDERRGRSRGRLMVRMMVPVTLLSAVLNNIPLVTIFTPIIKRWAAAQKLPASAFLIPLSYAAIFGGLWTLIGTSTNLVVHGLLLENDFSGFAFFELAKVGIPVTAVGYVYLATAGRHLLPDRHDVLSDLSEEPKEYFIEMLVPEGSPLIGKTVEQARLRNLQGVYLTDIERQGTHLGPVTPDRRLAPGDRLFFAGRTDGVADVVSMNGLVPVDEQTLVEDTAEIRRYLVEVVISDSAPVVGHTIRDYNFRSEYDAAVVAVSRNGQRVQSRLGDVELAPGDTLVLLTRNGFAGRYQYSRDFYLVSSLERITPEARRKGGLAALTVLAMVMFAAIGAQLPEIAGTRIDMFYAAAAAAMVLVFARTISAGQARDAIRWDVLLTIGAAFGVSRALINSGVAQVAGDGIVALLGPLGVVGGLAAVVVLTLVFTEIITNNAAAALMVPVAIATATELGVEAFPFFVAVAVGASASFATPIGYQTNLIVQGPGGYRFRDFVRVGLPLDVLVVVTAVASLSFWYVG